MTVNERKKVILYNPIAVFFDMPLALLAIGSALDSEKFEVIIIDARIEDDAWKTIQHHLDEAVCFGVTCLTGRPIKDAIDISRKVKTHNPDLPVVWGGWHTSLFPEATLKDECSIDITVQGQGERTFIELIDAFSNQRSLIDIPGICFKNEAGEVVKNRPRTIVPMDEFATINYDLIDVEKYFQKKGRRQLDYISSTGCYFRCTFCADPQVYERKWTAVSPDKMLDTLEALHKKYRFTDLNLQDETYFTYRNRVVEIAQGIIDRKLDFTWAATMRADQGARLSEEEFETCVKSGMRRLLIGVESGSQEMMDWLKKDIKMEQVILCAERCAKYKVAAIFPFIVGFPNESIESVNATVDMALNLNKQSEDFSTPIFYFKPYPGTAITDDVVKSGYQMPQTLLEWADFDYIGSSGPWVDAEKFQFFERYKFYLKLAYSKKKKLLFPIQWLAKKRCQSKNFNFPIEKGIIERFKKQQQLS